MPWNLLFRRITSLRPMTMRHYLRVPFVSFVWNVFPTDYWLPATGYRLPATDYWVVIPSEAPRGTMPRRKLLLSPEHRERKYYADPIFLCVLCG